MLVAGHTTFNAMQGQHCAIWNYQALLVPHRCGLLD